MDCLSLKIVLSVLYCNLSSFLVSMLYKNTFLNGSTLDRDQWLTYKVASRNWIPQPHTDATIACFWALQLLLLCHMVIWNWNFRFSKDPETFPARKAIEKSRTLRLLSCFIHKLLIWTEALFIQEVSDAYTSPFLDTDELKMVLWARKVSGTFEKQAPDL